MPEENKKKLVELVTGKGIPLIEDDIYGDLCFQLHRPRAAKAYDKRGLVLLCSSFSKTLAPGYRVGWITAGQYQAKVERLKAMSTVATTTLVQMALGDFLAEGGYDHHLRRFRKVLQANLRHVTEMIQRNFPEGTRVTRPQGGYLLWVQMPGRVDALVLHQKALDHKISIAPGHLFSPSQRYKNCIRLNCGIRIDAKVEKGLETLGRLVGKGS
jgi:DNA-binding transcriptional MocR family regulator